MRRSIAGLCVAAILALAGCGSSTTPSPSAATSAAPTTAASNPASAPASAAPISGTIDFVYGAFAPQSYWETYFTAFLAANPAVKINYIPVSLDNGWGVYTQKIATLLAGGQNVDVIWTASEGVPPLAAKYGARLIALCMEKSGIPVSAEARVGIAMEKLMPRAEELGIPMDRLYIDPLILTVSGCQEYVPQAIEAVRMLKMVADPAPMTVVGLSNVSNQVPAAMRPLLNRTYMVMLLAVGLDSAIVDPLDEEQMQVLHAVETRTASSPVVALYLKLFDVVKEGGELEADAVDMKDPAQVEIWKTVQVLLNKVIYTDSYLRI